MNASCVNADCAIYSDDADTFNRLEAGHRAALETQEVGMGILENLGQQREQIERSRARL